MKKLFALALALILLTFSAVPAFADIAIPDPKPNSPIVMTADSGR